MLSDSSYLKPKWVFVVDTKNSALWRSAVAHSRKSHVVVIAATEYFSPLSLAKDIALVDPEFVIFSWRPAFDAIVFSIAPKEVIRSTGALILLLIPDHAGLDFNQQREQERIHLSDGLLVTSKRLREEYSRCYKVKKIQVLHDLPDIELIESIKSGESLEKAREVIWVGNSRWGERLGYKDHKGFKRFVIPARKALESLDNSSSFKLIDSSFGKLPYKEVLESIRDASCLIITSDSEGTCLPLIEACALGTPVVTFDVGIASELLIDELQSQISPRDLRIFTELIIKTLSNRDEISRRAILRFDSYRHSVETDLHQLNFTTGTKGGWREARVERFSRNSLLWKLRWLKNFTKES